MEIDSLIAPNHNRIVLIIMDGVGDVGTAATGYRTPLAAARTPNLDALATESVLGLHYPVAPGITPGSVPGHFALFGYDPVTTLIGRGAVDAMGMGIDFPVGAVAARGNFATVREGVVTDRRAGRLPSADGQRLCALLDGMRLGDVTVRVYPVKEHRLLAVFSGPGVSPHVSDTDPQETGHAPLPPRPLVPEGAAMADVVARFVQEANALLADEPVANSILLRGFDARPALATHQERFGLQGAAIATYPTYRGAARIAGMDLLPPPADIREALRLYPTVGPEYNYVFIHFKDTDAAGEDGDFDRKVAAIEAFDEALPPVLGQMPEVLAITGDHASPVPLRSHGWHPVPLLLRAEDAGRDGLARYTEATCRQGSLGVLRGQEVMTVMLAAARKLRKFGP